MTEIGSITISENKISISGFDFGCRFIDVVEWAIKELQRAKRAEKKGLYNLVSIEPSKVKKVKK